jgi:eukaryotic-like serine/threonine-protein kinase
MVQVTVFCAHCGAANEAASTTCFACGRELGKPGKAAVEAEPRLVKERYRIVRQVGTGGFGAVYLAEDTLVGNQRVALKEIRLAGLKPQEMIEATDAFNREVSLLPGLHHPHLPRVYDHFTDPEHWYLVMEFIEGETLESYVQKVRGGRLPVEAVLDIGIQLADVLEYLHSRQPPIIFRDLKPANIMRIPTGHLYLIDFGIARIFKPGQVRDTIAFGSPGYAPPEQYGKAQTTAQADLYSLGATLHFLLSGDDPANTPFSFAPLSLSTQPAISHLQQLLMQMVELDASKRPASTLAVKRELQEIATELLQERLRALYPVDMPSGGFIQPYIPSSTGSGGWQGQQGQIQMGLPAQNAYAKRGQTRRRFVRVAAGAILTTIAAGSIMQFLGNFESHPEFIGSGASPQPAFGMAPVGTTYYTYTDALGAVSGVSWSPHGKYIVMGGYSQVVRVFRAASWENTASRKMDNGAILAVVWSPDGEYIATAGETVQVWLAPAFSQALTTYQGHKSHVNAIAWSPHRKFIASASDDNTVQVWEAKTGTHINTYRGHHAPVNAVAWSPHGNYIASGCADGTVHIWEPFQVSDTLFTYREHTDQVNAVSWSPRHYGSYIASAGGTKDKTVRVWSARSGETRTVYTGHTGAVRTVAWSPTERRIASAGDDKNIYIWDAMDGGTFFDYDQDSDAVLSLAWSPDGKCIVSGSFDRTMQIWQAG